jgi:hypothetical protein
MRFVIPSVRPEPVEGLFSLAGVGLKEREGFDKLSPNGIPFRAEGYA